jgi:hypothetical protein
VIYARRERAAGADGKAGAYATILYTRSRPDNRFTEWVHSWFYARERTLASEQLKLLELDCRHIIRRTSYPTCLVAPEEARPLEADDLSVKTLAERFEKLCSDIHRAEQDNKVLDHVPAASNNLENSVIKELKESFDDMQNRVRQSGDEFKVTVLQCANDAGNTVSSIWDGLTASVGQVVGTAIAQTQMGAADIALLATVGAANVSSSLDGALQTTSAEALHTAKEAETKITEALENASDVAQSKSADLQNKIGELGKFVIGNITGDFQRQEGADAFERAIKDASSKGGDPDQEIAPVATENLTAVRKKNNTKVAASPSQQESNLITDLGNAPKPVVEEKSASQSGPASTNSKAASSKAIDIHVDIQPEDWEKAEILVATELARAYSDPAISEQVAKFTAEPGVIAGSRELEQQMAGGLKSRKFFGLSAKELDGESVDELQFRIMYVYLEAFDHAATNNLKELIILPFHPLNLEDAQRKKFIEAMLSTIHVQLSLYPSMRVKLIARTEDEETELKSALASTAQAL